VAGTKAQRGEWRHRATRPARTGASIYTELARRCRSPEGQRHLQDPRATVRCGGVAEAESSIFCVAGSEHHSGRVRPVRTADERDALRAMTRACISRGNRGRLPQVAITRTVRLLDLSLKSNRGTGAINHQAWARLQSHHRSSHDRRDDRSTRPCRGRQRRSTIARRSAFRKHPLRCRR